MELELPSVKYLQLHFLQNKYGVQIGNLELDNKSPLHQTKYLYQFDLLSRSSFVTISYSTTWNEVKFNLWENFKIYIL
jgi:hypothetical protein